MKTLLVTAACQRERSATVESGDDLYDAPLGVLALAAVLERQGMPVSIVDSDTWLLTYASQGGSREDWPHAFGNWLAEQGFAVYGFSTICSSFPATLRIAAGLRALRPDAQIILGGPQASVTDEACMREFESLDYVVRGEADETLPRLLEAINSGGRFLDFVPGITYRSGRSVRRNPNAPIVANLDSLPLPAFHMLGKFRSVPRAALELGRGCPFACRFCSTNDFFRRNFRLKSPAVMIDQMRTMQATFGTRVFSLVHDMFTVDRKAVVAFCRAMIEADVKFEWSCSARTDCVDHELLRLMAEAGCQGVFFGVETGSARLQKAINKNLDLTEARANVQAADECNISTTVSLIAGFPEETDADFRDTLAFLTDSARLDSTLLQLHILAPLAGTPLELQYHDQLQLDNTVSDISGAVLSEEDLHEIRRYPEIFPNFYSVPTILNRCYLRDVRSFFLFGFDALRWLFVTLHQITGDVLDVHGQWLTYCVQNGNRPAFRSEEGVRLFLAFAADRYGDSPAVTILVAYYRALLEWPVANAQADDSGLGAEGEALTPVLSPHVRLLRIPGSLVDLLGHMRRGTCNLFRNSSPSVIVVRRRTPSQAEVLAMPPLGTLILELCDGVRDLAEIAAVITEANVIQQIPASSSAIVAEACRQLQKDELISFRKPAARTSQVCLTPDSHAGAAVSLA